MFVLYVVLTNLLLGFADMTRKVAVDHSGVQQVQVVSCLVGIVMLPFYLWWSPPFKPEHTYGYAMALVTAVLIALGMLCFSAVLRGPVNAGIVAAMCSLTPIVTVALACLFYDQSVTPVQWIAFVMAVLSIVLVNF